MYSLKIQRLPISGGRGRFFSARQEAAVVNMVVANSAIRLCEIREAVIAGHDILTVSKEETI